MARRLKTPPPSPQAPPLTADVPTPTPKRRRVHQATVDLRQATTTPSAKFSDAELAIQALYRLAKEARGDLTLFYNLAMKHELTKVPLQAAPHQVLMFSFMQHHDRCVFRQPIGTGKTFSMTAASLWLTGNDATQRGAVVGKTQTIASKPLKMVADYVTEPSLNAGVHLVFPDLIKSSRPTDKWTQTVLTVKRPAGIRDPSLIAAGLDTNIQGSRLSWVLGDDMLDMDNTATPEARQKTINDFEGHILSRLDTTGDARCVVTNTPWDREDLTFYLERTGWPTMQMDIYGFIQITNADAAWLAEAEQTLIRPSAMKRGYWRLRAHDPDPRETIPLWPEKIPAGVIEKIRRNYSPHQFARLYLCEPFDAEAQRCQRDWVEKCKRRGLGTTLVREYHGPNPTFCGIDLGIGNAGKNDQTVFFVVELENDGSRRILNIESGRWSGPEIVERIERFYDAYRCSMVVESNQAQDYIRQFAKDKRPDLFIHAHTTTRANKQSQDFGVESIFTELEQGAWIIPCDVHGTCDPEVQRWIDDMLYYQPSKHTGDHLMASWIARERIRRGAHHDPIFHSHSHSEWLAAAGHAGF